MKKNMHSRHLIGLLILLIIAAGIVLFQQSENLPSSQQEATDTTPDEQAPVQEIETSTFAWNGTTTQLSFSYPMTLGELTLTPAEQPTPLSDAIREAVGTGSLLSTQHVEFRTSESGYKTPLEAVVIEADTMETAERVALATLRGSIQNPAVFSVESRTQVNETTVDYTLVGQPGGEAVPDQVDPAMTAGRGRLVHFGTEGHTAQFLFIYIDDTYAGEGADLLEEVIYPSVQTTSIFE